MKNDATTIWIMALASVIGITGCLVMALSDQGAASFLPLALPIIAAEILGKSRNGI